MGHRECEWDHAPHRGQGGHKADGGGVEKPRERLKPGEGLEWRDAESRERKRAGWSGEGRKNWVCVWNRLKLR